jgi:aldehyde dehydrogenase (NAD+)
MDPAIVQVVEGAREATGAVLKERFDKIFFTGGSFVGKMVAQAAAEHLTPCVLELGGKSPVFVTSSADVVIAARRIAWGAFMNCGQTCVRPDYCLVDESVAAKFVLEVEKCVSKMYSENAQDSEFFGRLINERAVTRVADVLKRTDKACIKFGGQTDLKNRFVSPTLVDFGTDMKAFEASAVMEDELFSPILPVFRYTSLDDAVAFVNSKEKPLSCYLFSTESATTNKILTNTTSGSSNVNDVMMHMCNPNLPFGGVGNSGMGRYHGKYSFECFSHFKSVLFKQNIGDLWVRYPPYSTDKVFVLSVFQKTRPGWIGDMLKWGVILLVIFAMRKTGWVGEYAHELVKLVLEE